MTWQPIETAPKDGTEVLLTDGHYKRTGYWAKRVGVWSMDAAVLLNMPTHWAPLPDPPFSPEKERDTEDVLWKAIANLAEHFSEHASNRSDAFELLACILAWYQSRGTSPDEMLSPEMRARITFYLEHPPTFPEHDA